MLMLSYVGIWIVTEHDKRNMNFNCVVEGTALSTDRYAFARMASKLRCEY